MNTVSTNRLNFLCCIQLNVTVKMIISQVLVYSPIRNLAKKQPLPQHIYTLKKETPRLRYAEFENTTILRYLDNFALKSLHRKCCINIDLEIQIFLLTFTTCC